MQMVGKRCPRKLAWWGCDVEATSSQLCSPLVQSCSLEVHIASFPYIKWTSLSTKLICPQQTVCKALTLTRHYITQVLLILATVTSDDVGVL